MSTLALKWQRPEVVKAILDQLSDAVFLYDKDLYIIGVNRAAQRLFGMSSEGIIGRQCHELFRCAACEPECGVLQGLGQPPCLPVGTVNLHTGNGRERMVVIRTVQLHDEAGALEGVVATVKDITAEAEPAKRQIVAESRAMGEMLNFVRRVAVSEAASILVEGETGTGKDLIAKTLHYQSQRQAEPFMTINCAAIPENLLESELFGYEKGAFTDARSQKQGLFELADKGTLFLDEIGEIPLSLQAKLLRVLEDRSFRRLGGLRDITVDVRIIAATNRDLSEAVKEGAFRQDLYYRLNVIQLVVPALRDRPADILPLARFFIDHYNRKFKRQIDSISPEAESQLLAHPWPGNVRELKNAIERAMILEETGSIQAGNLPIATRTPDTASSTAAFEAPVPPADGMSLPDQERRLLDQALQKCAGNQTQAAQLLRITRDTLRYKMKKFNLR